MLKLQKLKNKIKQIGTVLLMRLSFFIYQFRGVYMIKVNHVESYITDNVLHSKQWDMSSEDVKTKAVNNSIAKLKQILKPEIEQGYELEIEDVALQAVWMLKVDDSFQRAEMGATYIAVDGIMLMFSGKDNTLSPDIANKFGISLFNGVRRKAGSYRIAHSTNYRIPVSDSQKLASQRVND
ncbi:hypothetical protein CBF36_03835 [Vagococcus bubulae]|uniref:Uncharacterized protein n=3 Tax=Vagococcus bubulae TaxID=1977868 RepID=A0A429ZNW0_9ENTE|nr:hypothetical protein CBF36_03835 [Vagococcus bubulae]